MMRFAFVAFLFVYGLVGMADLRRDHYGEDVSGAPRSQDPPPEERAGEEKAAPAPKGTKVGQGVDSREAPSLLPRDVQ